MPFAVVKFAYENRVGVVPENWLAEVKGIYGAFYPDYKVADKIQNEVQPTKHWRHYKAKPYIKGLETYESAKEQAKLYVKQDSEAENQRATAIRQDCSEEPEKEAETQADLSEDSASQDLFRKFQSETQLSSTKKRSTTQDEDETSFVVGEASYNSSKRQRKETAAHKKPTASAGSIPTSTVATVPSGSPPYSPSSPFSLELTPGSQQDVVFNMSQRQRKQTSPHKNISKAESTISVSLTSPSQRRATATIFESHPSSTPTVSQTSDTPDTPNAVPDMSQRMQTKICASLESIANSQQTALQLLRRLVANNDDGDEDDILGAPVENENELQELERKLEDKNNRKKLVSVLSAYGGRTIGRVVATIMSKIATDHVFKNYSLKGQRGKRKFKRLQIYKIVIRATRRCRDEWTINEINNEIMEYLKRAPRKASLGKAQKEEDEFQESSDEN